MSFRRLFLRILVGSGRAITFQVPQCLCSSLLRSVQLREKLGSLHVLQPERVRSEGDADQTSRGGRGVDSFFRINFDEHIGGVDAAFHSPACSKSSSPQPPATPGSSNSGWCLRLLPPGVRGGMMFRTERDIHLDSPSQLKVLHSFTHPFIQSFFPSLIVGRNRRSGNREVE